MFDKRKKEWISRMKRFLSDDVQKKKEKTTCTKRLPVEVSTLLLLPTLLTSTCRIQIQRTCPSFDLLKIIILFLEHHHHLIVNSLEALIAVNEGLQREEIIRIKSPKKVPVEVPKHPLINFQLAVNSETNVKFSNWWLISEIQKQLN